MPTKLIEVALPLDVINREAAREKSIRHGHPSTLHLWWARRPLAACRAVLFAQLVDDPSAHPELFPTEADQERERRRLFDIIERLVTWEATNNKKILEEATAEIRRCYPNGLPAIVDPFCGGGSIPLEAQRLGLEVHASDLNPVAVLITKVLVEIPPQFADRPPVHRAAGATLEGTETWQDARGLAEDVRFYGEWMRDEAERRIGGIYPKATLPDGRRANVIAWIWARTVPCPNPACRGTVPLIRSFWLSKKKGQETWLTPTPDPIGKQVHFEVCQGVSGRPTVDGTMSRSGARCLICDSPVPLAHIKQEAVAGRMGVQLTSIVAEADHHRLFLPASAEHVQAADVPRPADFPDTKLATHSQYMGPPRYGLVAQGDLFTNRQLTALCTLSDLVQEAHLKVLADSGNDQQYAAAIATYLAFGVSRLADLQNSLACWENTRTQVRHLFTRQSIPMIWDFAECGLFAGAAGDFGTSLGSIVNVIPGVHNGNGHVEQTDATRASFEGLVLSTDPPYYDNVPYSDLADFFYVWLRRSLQPLYPRLLATVLTPKAEELVADHERFGGRSAAESHFEAGFRRVFANAAAQCVPDTPMTIYYAFKQTESVDEEAGVSAVASTGWEKMLDGLLRSGLTITGTWPMRTELNNRMRNQASNALASSIVLVCRQRAESAGVTDRRGFVQALKGRLGHALRDLQSGGIAPVDLAQAAIGPGMAVFSRYAKVIEPNGEPMRVRTALALINQILDEVAAEQEGEFDEDTRWAIAWYAEHGMDDGPFGRADDLSRAKNVSVDGLVRAGLVKSGGGKVRLLDRDELDPRWDPTEDSRLTVWEVTQHLIQRLLSGNEASAAELLARVGGLGDAARDLAYRLFLIAESKKWAKEAGPYNALAASWLDISRLAAAEPGGQGSFF